MVLLLEPVGAGDLGEAREAALVAAHGGAGVLAPYGRAELAARPLILVHGIKGRPGELRAIAEHLLAGGRVQPYVFFYNDLGRYLDRCGDDLARALATLACHQRQAQVVIVAHSMGGIVARCALNSMTDPRWFSASQSKRGRKRKIRGAAEAERAGERLEGPCVADFASLDLVAVDTPWAGFNKDPRIDLRRLWRGQRSWVDMVSNSAVLTRLNATSLPSHVQIHHVEADQAGAGLKQDKIRTLGDLDDDDLVRLQRAILGDHGALGADRRRHNLLAALADESSFLSLAAGLRETGVVDAASFRATLRQAVPRLAGSHSSVLGNTALLAILDAFLKSSGT